MNRRGKLEIRNPIPARRDETNSNSQSPGPQLGVRAEWGAIVVALVYPSLLTLVYFDWLWAASSAVQQAAYGIGKLIQFALPIVWIGLVQRERLSGQSPAPRGYPAGGLGGGLGAGIAFGLAIVAAMFAVYCGWLRSTGLLGAAAEEIRARLAGIGVSSGAAYAGMALFYSLLHSLLEEYYWRWFVYGRLRRVAQFAPAIFLSSVAFAAHHVIVLAWYFGWGSGWTWLLSAAVAIGGAFWAWLYERSGSIYGPWASHLIIDAGIFAIGYDLVRSAT